MLNVFGKEASAFHDLSGSPRTCSEATPRRLPE